MNAKNESLSSDSSSALQEETLTPDVKIEQLRNENIDLQNENETLKSQIARTLEIPAELEKLHSTIRSLSSQLNDATQKSNTQQLCIQKFQAKNQANKKKIQELNDLVDKLTHEKEIADSNISKIKNEQSQIQEAFERSSAEQKTYSMDAEHFFSDYTIVTEYKVNSYEEVIKHLKSVFDEFSNLKKEVQTCEEEKEHFIQTNEPLLQAKKQLKKYQKAIKILDQQNQALKTDQEKMTEEKENNEKNSETLQSEQAAQIESQAKQIKILSDKFNQSQNQLEELTIQLKQSIVDREQDVQRLQQTIDHKDARIAELTRKLTTPDHTESNEMHNILAELSSKKRELEELKSRLTDEENLNDRLRNKISTAASRIQKYKNQKAQYKKNLKTCSEKQTTFDYKIREAKKENDALNIEIEQARQTIENLQIQLKAAQASHTEGEAAWTCKSQEIKRLKGALETAESSIEKQRKEINHYTLERNRMVEIIQSQNQIITSFESIIQSNQDANKDLAAKNKQLSKQLDKERANASNESIDKKTLDKLNQSLTNNINDNIKYRLLQVSNDQHLTPNQKIQSICQEVANAINHPKTNPQDIQRLESEKEELSNKNKHIYNVVDAVIHSFQNLMQEQRLIENSKPALINQSLVDFITINSAKLEESLKENDLISPQFISMDFLFNGSYDERRLAIQKLANNGWDYENTFSLFCVQCLTNIAQSREIEKLVSMTNDQAMQLDQINEVCSSNDINEAINAIKSLIDQKSKMKKVHKQCMVEATEELQKQKQAYEQQIEAQKEKIHQLEHDFKVLVQDAAVLQKEVDSKTKQFNSIEKSHKAFQEDTALLQKKHLEEMNQFEKAIDERNKENHELMLKLNQLQSDSSQQIKGLKKANQELRDAYNKKQEKFSRIIKLLNQKKKNLEDQLNSRMTEQERIKQNEMQQMARIQDDLKMKLTETIQTMQEQNNSHKETTQKLTESLAQSEQRNKKMSNEIAKLSITKKSLEFQLNSLNDQMKREIQLLNSQFAFKTMTAETQHQEQLAAQKNEWVKEKTSLMLNILNDFDQIDDYDDDIDECLFNQAIRQISHDYKKMKIEQHKY